MVSSQSKLTRIEFGDLSQMLDAMMLYGATLRRDKAQAKLVISRSSNQWPTLYWALTVLHNHGIDTKMTNGASTIRSKLTFSTSTNIFYRNAHERWYRDGRAVTPHISLSDESMATWLVDGLARCYLGRSAGLRLRAPMMSQAVAEDLAEQITDLTGWSCSVGRAGQYYSVKLHLRSKATSRDSSVISMADRA